MPRATNNPASRRRRKKVLKQAKGYYAGRRKLIRRTVPASKWTMILSLG